MEIVKDTLDDLLFESYKNLLAQPFNNNARRSETLGPFSEIFGVLLELKNPKARLSRSDVKSKIFSSLGELLWYLDGSEDLEFIKYYIPAYTDESFDNKTIYGAYGPRLYNSDGKHNQVKNIIEILSKNDGTSRRAAIQLFESRDIAPGIEENSRSIPCTCTLHLLKREGKLSMIVFMRSNDAFLGLPHDIYTFTMLQEHIATSLGLDLGTYKHTVSSFHMYQKHKEAAQDYVNEGVHSTKLFMDAMPSGDQTAAIKELLKLEKRIRLGESYDISASQLHPYWMELAYLLAFFRASKTNDVNEMKKICGWVTNSSYTYILDKKLRSVENPKD